MNTPLYSHLPQPEIDYSYYYSAALQELSSAPWYIISHEYFFYKYFFYLIINRITLIPQILQIQHPELRHLSNNTDHL
jgi:hypothetical protein